MTEPVPKTLHEHDFIHLTDRIDALDRFLTAKIDAMDERHKALALERGKAVDIALTAAKEKAAAHNELIAQMKEQQATYFTKDQADLQSQLLASKVDALEKAHVAEQAKDKTIGMSTDLIMKLLVAASIIISMVVVFANWQTAK